MIAMSHDPFPCLPLGVLTTDGEDMVFIVPSSFNVDQEMCLNCLHVLREDIWVADDLSIEFEVHAFHQVGSLQICQSIMVRFHLILVLKQYYLFLQIIYWNIPVYWYDLTLFISWILPFWCILFIFNQICQCCHFSSFREKYSLEILSFIFFEKSTCNAYVPDYI